MSSTGTWAQLRDKTWFRALIGTVVALLFVGSVLLSVFAGGELSEAEAAGEVKGFLRLSEAKYSSTYLVGDTFVFDKEESCVNLVVKDPAREEIVVVDDLDGVGYGFQVNGEGDIHLDASEIVMTADVEKISVVSRDYPTIKTDLPTTVISAEGIALSDDLLLEAERDADIYREGKLLSYTDKTTLPNTSKPFISSAGSSPDGLDCSGGACLRNFQKENMRVVYRIVCTEETEVEFTVLICKKPKSKNMGEWFDITLNGVHIAETEAQSVPAAAAIRLPVAMLPARKGF